MKTKFFNANIVTCNENFDVLNNGTLVVNDNVIEFVGDVYQGTCDREIDCHGNILMPGLINAHCHTECRNKNDSYSNSYTSYSQMMKSGITCVVDLNTDALSTAKAMRDTNIRGVVGIKYTSVLDVENIIEQIRNCQNINYVLFIDNVFDLTEEDYGNCLKLCKQYDMPFTVHASETLYEVGECDKEFGLTPIELLENYGMFDIPCIVSKATNVDKEEMQILSNYNVSIATTPTADLASGNGIAPICAFNSNDINVCIGSDSTSVKYDILNEMNMLSNLQKGIMHNPNAIENNKVIKYATVNSAKAYNISKTGVLKNGYFGDIILLQASDRSDDILDQIVNYLTKSDVLMTMVNGQILYENL